MLTLVYEGRFSKDIEKAKKRGKDMAKLYNIVTLLVAKKALPIKNRNHKLVGNFKDHWECHVEPDWLLIYKKTSTTITLIRTGTHADLF
jgi:mRNA interferase YafQ